MTNSQREWLIASKSVFEFTNKIVAPVMSFALVLVSVYTIQYVVATITGSELFGSMAFYTSIFIIGLNVISSEVYNYVNKKVQKQYLEDYLKKDDGTNNSDRGHSRDDSGAGQPDSQDKTQ